MLTLVEKLAFDSTAAVWNHRLINPAPWSAEQGCLAPYSTNHFLERTQV